MRRHEGTLNMLLLSEGSQLKKAPYCMTLYGIPRESKTMATVKNRPVVAWA